MIHATDLAPCGETHPGADITQEQWEFMRAMDAYQRRFHRRYPTWREVLHVARCLGYRRIAKATELDQLPMDDLEPPTADDLKLEELRRRDAESS